MAKDEFDQMAATSGLINQHLLCNLKSSNLSFETWHCDSYDRCLDRVGVIFHSMTYGKLQFLCHRFVMFLMEGYCHQCCVQVY